MKTFKIIYWISTGLLSALMLTSAGTYFIKYEAVSESFQKLGHPIHIIYPLAIAKALGIVAIWANISKPLKEWAYAGFFFNFTLAFLAHVTIKDNEYAGALVAMVLLFTSYFSWKKLA